MSEDEPEEPLELLEPTEKDLEYIKRIVMFQLRRSGLHNGLDIGDYLQEGYFGWCRAKRRFNPDFKVKFEPYAAWWIRQAVNSANARFSWEPSRVPQYRRDLLFVSSYLKQRLRREPTHREIAEYAGFTIEDAARYIHNGTFESLDAKVYVGSNSSPSKMDSIGSSESSPDDLAWERTETRRIREALALLPQDERFIVEEIFYLDRNIASVSRDIGMTREGARQVLKRATEKLSLLLTEEVVSDEEDRQVESPDLELADFSDDIENLLKDLA